MYLLSPKQIFSFNRSNLLMALTFSKSLGQHGFIMTFTSNTFTSLQYAVVVKN